MAECWVDLFIVIDGNHHKGLECVPMEEWCRITVHQFRKGSFFHRHHSKMLKWSLVMSQRGCKHWELVYCQNSRERLIDEDYQLHTKIPHQAHIQEECIRCLIGSNLMLVKLWGMIVLIILTRASSIETHAVWIRSTTTFIQQTQFTC